MKKCCVLFQQDQWGVHRYAQGTFHQGVHRQAPGDSTPWRDVTSPVNRARGWWLAPMAKGTVIAAWCITFGLAGFCYSLQQDAKATYLLNNVLLRNLHAETELAHSSQQRFVSLQSDVRALSVNRAGDVHAKKRIDGTIPAPELDRATNVCTSGVTEIELVRERARADAAHERNEVLAKELRSLRAEIASVKQDNVVLAHELSKLRKSAAHV